MKYKSIILLLTVLCFNCKNPNIPLYVGTYTSGDSQGIYKYTFNTDTGQLNEKVLVAKTENPSFIAFSPNKKFLYSVNEIEDGQVSSFKIKKDGSLTFINKVNTKGAYPCHLSLDETGFRLAVSNYGGGNVALYKTNSDGSLNEVSQVLDHNSENQKSHAHSAQFRDEELFVADLGRNSLYQYTKDKEAYILKTNAIIDLKENSGPRHFAQTKDNNFIYIINEYANTVTVAKKEGNSFEKIMAASTLSDDYKDYSVCADIHLSDDELFLYGSNRGENTIVVFKRNEADGTIEKIQNSLTQGDWPRNFTIDPTGNFLLVANQKSNNIAIFKIDNESGKLNFLHDIQTASPVCLLF